MKLSKASPDSAEGTSGEKGLLKVGPRLQARRQAAIIYAELQAMRTLLQGYTVQDIQLPLLVVRVLSCSKVAVVESEREYKESESRILGCKRTREWQSRQRDCASEAVQALQTGSVRAAVVET